MKKETYILENSYTIPIKSEIQCQYYSNLDYLITSENIYICTSTRKGMNMTSIALPFNLKNIQEKCKNELKVVDNVDRYKLITILSEDIIENHPLNSPDDNTQFPDEPKLFEKKYINKNYLLIFGRVIGLYDPKNLEFLYQCQPLLSNSQNILPLLYTAISSYKSYIIIGSSAGHLLFGQIKNDKIEIIQITNHTCFPITDIDVSDNGLIAVAYDNGEIHIYKIENELLILLSTYTDTDGEIITQIQIGDYIIASYSTGQIRLFTYDEKDINLKCEMDLGYSEIKGIDYWNSQNIFTVIVDDFIGVWEIKKDDIIKTGFTRKIRTTTDLYKYTSKDKSFESNKLGKYDNSSEYSNSNTNSSSNLERQKRDTSKEFSSSNEDEEDTFSLSIELQWIFQCDNKYLNGIKFLKHLNSEAFNTDVKHNHKYIAVVAYDFSEINVFSITLSSSQ